MRYETELRAAIEAVTKAAALCRAVRETPVSDETIAKRDRSPVTVADYGAQAVVSLELERLLGREPVTGEEDAAALRANPELRARVVEAAERVLPGAGEG